MKKLKYLLGVVIALAVIALVVAIPAFAVSESDFTTEIADGGLAITAYNGSEKIVTVPAKINGKTVKTIISFNNDTVEEVVLPSGVRTIYYNAFNDCTNLFRITLNEGLESIGDNAFSDTKISEITIPASVTEMGEHGGYSAAFYGDNYLTTVIFAEGRVSIPNHAFSDCSSIENVVIPDSVKEIGECAFWGCSSLSSVVQSEPENGEYIKGFSLPKNLKTINRWAFCECTEIESIAFPSSLKYIYYNAFKDCSRLSDITLKKGLEYIGATAFSGTKISKVTIPASVTGMGETGGCTAAFYEDNYLTTVIFENGTVTIPGHAFSDCSSIENVVIPDSVKEIGECAFWGCSSLSFVVQSEPENGEYIKGFSLPKNLKTINSWAFCECTEIESIAFPSSLKYIYYNAFENCSKLSKIKLNEGLEYIGATAFSGTALKEVTIPSTVTGMGEMGGYTAVFYNAKQLEKVIFANGMVKIPDYALQNCSSIKEVFIPKSVTEVGRSALANCTSMSISGLKYSYAWQYAKENSIPFIQTGAIKGWFTYKGNRFYSLDNTKGTLAKGWQTIKNSKGIAYKYYFNSKGVMLTGWQSIKNSKGVAYKYYFHTNGVMLTGWQSLKAANGKTYKYYFYPKNGAMLTGWQTISGKKYYLYPKNGIMLTGWHDIKNSKGVAYKYYFGTDGVMRTGWQSIKNSKGVAYKYYFGDNGYMRTGWQWIANSKGVKYRYYFGANGVMRTGWQNIKASNGKTYKYYFYSNGVNVINQKVKIGTKTYNFNKYGICTNA